MSIPVELFKESINTLAKFVHNRQDQEALYALVEKAARQTFCPIAPEGTWARSLAERLTEYMKESGPALPVSTRRQSWIGQKLRRVTSRSPIPDGMNPQLLRNTLREWARGVMARDPDFFQQECERCRRTVRIEQFADQFPDTFSDIILRESEGRGKYHKFAKRLCDGTAAAGELQRRTRQELTGHRTQAAGAVATTTVAAGGAGVAVAAGPALDSIQVGTLAVIVVLALAGAAVLIRRLNLSAGSPGRPRPHVEAAKQVLLIRTVDHRMTDIVTCANLVKGDPRTQRLLEELHRPGDDHDLPKPDSRVVPPAPIFDDPAGTLCKLAAEFVDELLPQLVALEIPVLTDSATRLAVELDSLRRGLSFAVGSFARAARELFIMLNPDLGSVRVELESRPWPREAPSAIESSANQPQAA